MTSNPTKQQLTDAISETLKSNLSIDDKIVKLTSIKAEILIAMKAKGHKFVSENRE